MTLTAQKARPLRVLVFAHDRCSHAGNCSGLLSNSGLFLSTDNIQVVAVDWIFSFRIKCVGLEPFFGPHQWWTAEAVLDIVEGH